MERLYWLMSAMLVGYMAEGVGVGIGSQVASSPELRPLYRDPSCGPGVVPMSLPLDVWMFSKDGAYSFIDTHRLMHKAHADTRAKLPPLVL